MQVFVHLRRAPDPPKRIDEFDGRALDCLMHAPLERRFVVEERRGLPGHAEESELVEQHGGDPGVLIDVEVHQVRRCFDDLRTPAGLRRCGVWLRLGFRGIAAHDAAARFGHVAGGLRDLAVGFGVVGIEIVPDLGRPEEIAVEADKDDQDRGKDRFQDSAETAEGSAEPDKRLRNETDDGFQHVSAVSRYEELLFRHIGQEPSDFRRQA